MEPDLECSDPMLSLEHVMGKCKKPQTSYGWQSISDTLAKLNSFPMKVITLGPPSKPLWDTGWLKFTINHSYPLIDCPNGVKWCYNPGGNEIGLELGWKMCILHRRHE